MDSSKEGNPARRWFAAKRRYGWQGWTLIGLAAYGTTVNLGQTSPRFEGLLVTCVFVLSGIYLLRGKPKLPTTPSGDRHKEGLARDGIVSAEDLEKVRRGREDLQRDKIKQATYQLSKASGAAAVVAHRKLVELLRSGNHGVTLDEIFREIGFDRESIVSTKIGVIPVLTPYGAAIEVFEKWIICVDKSFDVDSTTHGEVFLEGSVQIDSSGSKRDLRSASVQFVSSSWTTTFPISPDEVPAARLVVARLEKMSAVANPSDLASDIRKVLEDILNSTKQTDAEKIEQLSDLRYQRLLTDQEFESAKAKVLGI